MPPPEAVTYGIAYLTAYGSLMITGNIRQRAGKTIYIAGAGGGLGHFAAQMAKLSGLNVIGTAGKAASLELLRRLHVDHVIDYSLQNVVEEIMRLTDGKGVHLVSSDPGHAGNPHPGRGDARGAGFPGAVGAQSILVP